MLLSQLACHSVLKISTIHQHRSLNTRYVMMHTGKTIPVCFIQIQTDIQTLSLTRTWQSCRYTRILCRTIINVPGSIDEYDYNNDKDRTKSSSYSSANKHSDSCKCCGNHSQDICIHQQDDSIQHICKKMFFLCFLLKFKIHVFKNVLNVFNVFLCFL